MNSSALVHRLKGPAAGTLALLGALGLFYCKQKPTEVTSRAGVQSSASAAARADEPIRLPPLQAESWRIDLPVPGFGPASVAVPLGARSPRPILIALHGTGDRADWQCGTWRGISGPHAFILCPQGVQNPGTAKGSETFTYGPLAQTEQELRAALHALKARFGQHVAPGPVVLAGYSLGAYRAARIARQEPSFFNRLVLIEGAHETWSAGDAAVFAKGGGQKLMIVCAQAACASSARRAVLFTERARAEAELVYPGPLGHLFDGRVASAIKPRFAWLVAGDARWKAASEGNP
jgi:pimeloyl-ACP methyl ester carboxylesterase